MLGDIRRLVCNVKTIWRGSAAKLNHRYVSALLRIERSILNKAETYDKAQFAKFAMVFDFAGNGDGSQICELEGVGGGGGE